ncbi:hypothetical protein Cantr_08042 [Candida viswanathii]|uniref:Mtf2-like C-terminal domain-containing protein n=1 Tax=Candida viswanathii TaxID=5486 RepID=A0A367Y3G5_9ASCO|nr:hypothetical protein Cantr_08042 [Candida viswanathii]
MKIPRTATSKATSPFLRSQSLALHRLQAARSIHEGATVQEGHAAVSGGQQSWFDLQNRFKEDMDSQPKLNSVLDSEESSSEFDLENLRNFIKDAYQKQEAPKPEPFENMNHGDYFHELLGEYNVQTPKEPEQEERKFGMTFLDVDFKEEMLAKTTSALQRTLDHLDSFETSQELYNYTVSLLNSFQKETMDATKKKDVFLNHLFKGVATQGWTGEHQKVIDQIETQSSATPSEPILNVLTVPILFTHIINNLGFKFYNGQLALTMFGLLERDPNIYMLATSQKSFNLALRLSWINYGILDLHQFQKWFTRMKFLGYPGDRTTLNILKIVILEYDKLSHGKLLFNKNGDRISTRDCNWRIKYFRQEYENIRRPNKHSDWDKLHKSMRQQSKRSYWADN